MLIEFGKFSHLSAVLCIWYFPWPMSPRCLCFSGPVDPRHLALGVLAVAPLHTRSAESRGGEEVSRRVFSHAETPRVSENTPWLFKITPWVSVKKRRFLKNTPWVLRLKCRVSEITPWVFGNSHHFMPNIWNGASFDLKIGVRGVMQRPPNTHACFKSAFSS